MVSDDNNIITVNQSGVISAKRLGNATITVLSEDGNASISINVYVVDIDHFVKSSVAGSVVSYSSVTGLYTGTMYSYLKNESSKEITPISFDIIEASGNKSIFKITSFNSLLPGEEFNTPHYNLSNVCKPYIVWKYLCDGVLYTIEKRLYY